MKFILKSSKRLNDIIYIKEDFYPKKVFHDLFDLTPKAEEGWIKPDQYQVIDLLYRNLSHRSGEIIHVFGY